MIKKSTIIVFIIFLNQSSMMLGSNWFRNTFKFSVMEHLYAPVTGGVVGIGAGAILASGVAPVVAFALMGVIIGNQWNANKRDNQVIGDRKAWQNDVLGSLQTSHQGIIDNRAALERARFHQEQAVSASLTTRSNHDELAGHLASTGAHIDKARQEDHQTRAAIESTRASVQVATDQVGAGEAELENLKMLQAEREALELERAEAVKTRLEKLASNYAAIQVAQSAAHAQYDHQISEASGSVNHALSALDGILRGVSVRAGSGAPLSSMSKKPGMLLRDIVAAELAKSGSELTLPVGLRGKQPQMRAAGVDPKPEE
jgi:hypothetical protein